MTVRDLLRLNLLVFVVYAVIGTLTLLVGQYSGLASPVWPAAGLAFAAIYVWAGGCSRQCCSVPWRRMR